MFELCVQGSFAAAHRLRGYRGRCENLHGHNYRVEVAVAGEELDRCGLLADFSLLKEKLRRVLKRFDHVDLNRLAEFRRNNPSAENLARDIYRRMKKALAGLPVSVRRVSVWESENSYASYYE